MENYRNFSIASYMFAYYAEKVTDAQLREAMETYLRVIPLKKVYVENTGTSDQFVRVYLDFSDSRVRDNAMIVYQKENQTQTKSWDEFLRNLPENWTYVSYVSTDDTDYSTLGGYFYYTKVLKPDETTTALIDSITTDFRTDDTDTNTDNIKDFDIIVYSESVQTVEIDTSGTVYTDTDWKKAWKSFLHISENGS